MKPSILYSKNPPSGVDKRDIDSGDEIIGQDRSTGYAVVWQDHVFQRFVHQEQVDTISVIADASKILTYDANSTVAGLTAIAGVGFIGSYSFFVSLPGQIHSTLIMQ